ncbi:PTS galactitol transporter subunit IIC [Polycladomyces abyssicola]|uniref:PTS galactitol transporter subunit IIC n=1 Tax=Polycladomyces abyssicola TaxID=1125966 RepID=A0A8D5ZNF5_9BACL|nr:PTS transporter subunit IIC [Polycladomyces abyssicola]BCU81331.1 PTS galactitol transporter subunit IIC [Polycladomyces abyssicola]
MEVLKNAIHFVLDLGAPVFVPLIMIIVGLIVRMKFRDAFSSALTLGLAFIGMNMVVGFMMDSISPAAQAFVKNSGINLNAIDGGWTPMSTLAWAWPLAFLMFPVQIIINLLMLAFKQTNTLNVDLWNVWGKIFTAVLVIGVSGNIPLAFLIAAIQVVLELKMGDVNQKQIQKLTQIPGVTCTHGMTLFNVFLYPINRLLDYIPFLNKHIDANWLKQRIGIFAENHVMGFIIGVLIGTFAQYPPQKILILGVQGAAALTLFPMVARLFMEALAPLSDSISEYMKRKYSDRQLYIGLDWPFMAGCNELWVAMIIWVPITLLWAVILPGNNILPFGGIINLSLAVPALIVTGGNLLRMIVLGVLTTPVFLYVATYFAPTITNLAKDTHVINIKDGQFLSWSSIELPDFRYIFAQASNIVHGEFLGLVLAIGWLGLFYWYYKGMQKRANQLSTELDGTSHHMSL